MQFFKLFLFITLLMLTACGQKSGTSMPANTAGISADIVFTNANIYSLNWGEPSANGTPAKDAPFTGGQWNADAQAIAISEGDILQVGSNKDIMTLTGPTTQVIDLNGATIIPGLIDSHVHIAELGEVLQRVNLTDVQSPSAAIDKIKRFIDGAQGNSSEPSSDPNSDPNSDWIIGQGWDEGAWANNYPNRQMLDEAFGDRPVYLRSLHGFAVWANTKALQLAGIDKTTQAPVGGEILRDSEGQATGILLNRATTLLADAVPKPSLEQFASYIKGGMQQMAKDGFVAVHEAGAETQHIEALQYLNQNGQLPVRMYAMLSARDSSLAEAWIDKGPVVDPDGFLDIRAVKAYYDGALGSRGARLLEDYSDLAGHRGVSGDGYGFDAEIVDRLITAGFQVGIHAIGDAGNREVLDYFDNANKQMPDSLELRHRIEHAQVIDPSDFERIKQLKLIASMEPPHAVEDKTWAEDRLGAQRIKGAYAWRTLREVGVPITFNSDLPGSDHSIFYGLHAAITRQDKQSQPTGGWYPEQALSIEESIRAYTSWAAYSAFRETQTGKLKQGYWADLTVLDVDPFNLATNDPAKILHGKVLMTVIDGKIVYRKQ